jgi:23S rRNA pseudouridine2605 synthase
MRLNKYIALCGICSRRVADEYIQDGRVKINGQIVRDLGQSIYAETDIVYVDGKKLQAPNNFVYILLNKPRGILTTVSDEKGRRTVNDLIKIDKRIFPVGRLDKESAGALMLTNDGDLMNKLLHPSSHIPKEYVVLLKEELSEADIKRFSSGIRLDGKRTLPCSIERIGHPTARPRYLIILKEGRNRQIRRMISTLKNKVVRLKRRSFGGLTVEKLEPGAWRHISQREISLLKKRVEQEKIANQKSAVKN